MYDQVVTHATRNTGSPQLALNLGFEHAAPRQRVRKAPRINMKRFFTTSFLDPKVKELELAMPHLKGRRVEVLTTHGGWHGTGIVEGIEKGELYLSDYSDGKTAEDLAKITISNIKTVRIID